MKRIAWVLLTMLVLSACGNKGPLYLPGDEPDQQKRELKQ